ncbi:MAG TPA: hypothetical protein VMU48_08920 [Terracidiphilus sp.]|nr:hypothetical protein [Terracidiphilus sp.]
MMDHLAPLLQAAASVGWVIFAFVALFKFKPEITRALLRLKKGKVLGQEFELGEELTTLRTSVAAVTKEVMELPPGAPEASPATMARQEKEFDTKIGHIIQLAASSPKAALIAMRAEIERQAINALAIRGLLHGRPVVTLQQALGELRQCGFPPALEGSLEIFDSVRNRIVHGQGTTDDDALMALDSGMTILRVLSALPSEVHEVYHPGVEVFFDPECTRVIPGVKGVILEATSPGGVMKTKRIYATTKPHFKKGKKVAWEWNIGKQWAAAWYRDPDTGETKSAWGGCAEFVGRHLDDIPRFSNP